MNKRNITISSRNENTIDKIPHLVPSTEFDNLKIRFDENINSIRERFYLAEELMVNDQVDQAEDMYRTQIVFLESALDYYIHCLSIHASIEMSKDKWTKTGGYRNLVVPIEKVFEAIERPEDTAWIEEVIVGHHSSKTYMSCNEIKGQLSLVSNDTKLFKKIADKMYYVRGGSEKTEKSLKQLLDSIFLRRNKIAHQSDREHGTGRKFDIDKIEVENYVDKISEFVEYLHAFISEEA